MPPRPLLIFAALPLLAAACGPDAGGFGPGSQAFAVVGAVPDEPRLSNRADILFYENFGRTHWDATYGSFKHKSNATRVSGGHRGHRLRTRIQAGSHYGSSFQFRFSSHSLPEPEEVYFRYYLRFGSNWAPETTGKLPGLADLNGSNACKGGKPANGTNCWSARMMWRPVEGGTNIGFYVYHPDQAGVYGDQLMFDAEGYTPLDKDRWYCVEGHLKLNDPALADGRLRGWINGKPAVDRTGLRFRNTSKLRIASLWHDIYYGAKPVAPRTMDVYTDSFVLAENRIGCDPKPCEPVWEIGAEDELFKDMPPGSFAYEPARKMLENGITVGCRPEPNRMYCPGCEVTRSQMAAFLCRALHLPDTDADYFDDDSGSTFERDHNRLYESGITRGCGDRAFCGPEPVTREQMASFLVRALGLPGSNADRFTDDDDSQHQADIQALAAAGITRGCNPPDNDRFCPRDPVTRAQMAIFLTRGLGL